MADGVKYVLTSQPFYRLLRESNEQTRLEDAIRDAVRRSVARMLPPLRSAPIARFTRFK